MDLITCTPTTVAENISTQTDLFRSCHIHRFPPPLLENLNRQGGELGVGAFGAQINENLKENHAPQVSPPC